MAIPQQHLSFIQKALPWIGKAVSAFASGGPIGLLSVAAQGIGAVVNQNVPNTAEAITAAVVGATPDQLIQMKKIDDDFAVQMKQLGFQHEEEMEAVLASDRASAREREVSVRDWTPRILAYGVCLLCFAGEFSYFHWGAPSNAAPELIGRILGTLDSALILVLGYYFGSSAGSARKDETIQGLSAK